MRKIFEFKAFDVVNNPENQEFLKKVKTQNPDLYSRFVSIIGNKGLEVAKDKYNEYDPEWIKNRFRVKKKEKRKENKEQKKEDILKKYESEINNINSILKTSPLKKEILDFINDDKVLSQYLKSCGTKKHYTNLFLNDLKKPLRLGRNFESRFGEILTIDKLEFSDIFQGDWTISGAFYGDERKGYRYLEIDQLIELKNNKLSYTILPSFPVDDEYLIKKDREREKEFIQERTDLINGKFKKYGLDIKGLYDVIKQISYALSDDFYNDWKIEKDADRYNV